MKELSNEEKRLINFLPLGDEKPLPANELAKLMNTDNRYIRNLINHLITAHNIPIGAKNGRPNGYFIITNEVERTIALAPLLSQTQELTKRIDAISSTQLMQNKKAVNAD